MEEDFTTLVKSLIRQLGNTNLDIVPGEYTKNFNKFRHDPSSGEIFAQCYERYLEIFECKMSNLAEAEKVSLLMQSFIRSTIIDTSTIFYPRYPQICRSQTILR